MAGLEDLYKEVILDHYRSPRCRGTLAVPPASSAVGFNPSCGDEITVYCEVVDDRLTALRTAGQGCSISISSASMMGETLEGLSLSEVQAAIARFDRLMSVHSASLEAEADGVDSTDSDEVSLDDESLGDLVALRGVLRYPRRIDCARLGWTTLVKALGGSPTA